MKIFTGQVISNKMSKTATVAVKRVAVHPVYKKRFKRIKKYHVHTETDVEIGQTVQFVASRPYSKLKKWKIIGVVGMEGKGKKRLSSEDGLVNRKKVADKSLNKAKGKGK